MNEKLKLRLLSKEETIEMMLVEAKNDLVKCEVMDRLLVREKLAGKGTTASLNADGMNRHRMSVLKSTIENLEALLAEGDNVITDAVVKEVE